MNRRSDVLFNIRIGIEKTIWRGRKELEAELEGRPTDRVRLEGGGRPAVEKKRRKSSRT